MKNIILTTLILIGISLPSCVKSNKSDISPALEKTIKEEILKVHEAMKKAAETFDADALFEYVLDSNDVIIEDGLLRQTRKDALDITRQNLQGIKELTYSYSHKNIIVISSTTALWTGQGTTIVLLEDGREITIDFAESVVFILQDGHWKVLHAHRSSPDTN